MTLFNELLVFSTLLLYGIAAVFYFIGWKKDSIINQAALGLALVGLSFNFLVLLLRIVMSGRLPLHNGYEFVLCFSFVTVLMYIIYEKWSGNKNAGGIVMLINAFLFLSIPLLMYNQINYIAPVVPALQSSWLAVHVITAIIAYSAFALAASIALLQLKNNPTNDTNIFKIVATGFATLTLSIVLGAIWAEQAWGRYWSWDPKETWALISWIIYAIYLHLHRQRKWRGRNANILVVIGFIIVLFTFFGVNYLLSGLHSYA